MLNDLIPAASAIAMATRTAWALVIGSLSLERVTTPPFPSPARVLVTLFRWGLDAPYIVWYVSRYRPYTVWSPMNFAPRGHIEQ